MKKNLFIALMLLAQNTFAQDLNVHVKKCEYGSSTASVLSYQIGGTKEFQTNSKGQALAVFQDDLANGRKRISAFFTDENGVTLEGSVNVKEDGEALTTFGIVTCDSLEKAGRYQMNISVR